MTLYWREGASKRGRSVESCSGGNLTKGRSKREGDVVSKRELDNIKTDLLRRARRQNSVRRDLQKPLR
jgi:hypothetical protein